ncbi:hypothetical protein NEFER03_1165 [Nematocida sp. LUAm3]|nr:hypothetical protein NEFER03_1165 [Nematocida sp. LUAm3]KAI5178270.1 hypothetical protein NEFER01_1437 [Nematocida sp. LUAm1]
MLITASFLSTAFMNSSLKIAFSRLSCKENKFFPKVYQHYKTLFFLHKLGMQSEYARENIRKNYLTILPYAFYNKSKSKQDLDLRVLSISILKLIGSSESISCNNTHTTFVTCQSNVNTDAN